MFGFNRSDNTGSAVTMSIAGLKEFCATSRVGATIRNSADLRQLRINAVSMIAAAIVDLEFFFDTRRKNSRISRRPGSASYAPKITSAKSSIHGRQDSPIVGSCAASTIRSDLD